MSAFFFSESTYLKNSFRNIIKIPNPKSLVLYNTKCFFFFAYWEFFHAFLMSAFFFFQNQLIRGFEPHRRHCLVSLSKNIYPSLVLVQSECRTEFGSRSGSKLFAKELSADRQRWDFLIDIFIPNH